MRRVIAGAASITCAGLLALAFVHFAWEIVVAALVLILGLASATWLSESDVWHASTLVRALPSVWMVAAYTSTCALLFVDTALVRHVPGEAVVLTLMVAPLPWAIVGGVIALGRLSRRTAARTPEDGSTETAGEDGHPAG